MFLPALFGLLASAWLFVLIKGDSSSTAVPLIVDLFLITSMAVSFRFRRGKIGVTLVLSVVLLVQLLMSLGPEFYWMDFARAVKPWIYLALFFSCTDVTSAGNVKWLRRCLFLFAVGYLVSFLRGEPRPYLIVENNFEVPFVVYVWAFLVISDNVNVKSLETVAALSVAMLSMSRSGAFSALCVMALLLARGHRKDGQGYLSSTRALIAACALPMLGFVGAEIFQARTSDVQAIDRLSFFDSFIGAMRQSGVGGVIFGSGPVSEIPGKYCYSLAYYLEALAGKFGQCYSVVWHASFMRLVYDFGIVGLFLVYYLLFLVMRRKYSRYDSMIGIAPLFLAGLSVGGVYNFFSFLGVYIFFIAAKSRAVVPKLDSVDALQSRFKPRRRIAEGKEI